MLKGVYAFVAAVVFRQLVFQVGRHDDNRDAQFPAVGNNQVQDIGAGVILRFHAEVVQYQQIHFPKLGQIMVSAFILQIVQIGNDLQHAGVFAAEAPVCQFVDDAGGQPGFAAAGEAEQKKAGAFGVQLFCKTVHIVFVDVGDFGAFPVVVGDVAFAEGRSAQGLVSSLIRYVQNRGRFIQICVVRVQPGVVGGLPFFRRHVGMAG